MNRFDMENIGEIVPWMTCPAVFEQLKSILSEKTGEIYDGDGYTPYTKSMSLVVNSPYSIQMNQELHCYLHCIRALDGDLASINSTCPRNMSVTIVRSAFLFIAARTEDSLRAIYASSKSGAVVVYSKLLEDMQSGGAAYGPEMAFEMFVKLWSTPELRSAWESFKDVVYGLVIQKEGKPREGTIGEYILNIPANSLGFGKNTDDRKGRASIALEKAIEIQAIHERNEALQQKYKSNMTTVYGEALPGAKKAMELNVHVDPELREMRRQAFENRERTRLDKMIKATLKKKKA
jgi:hypothetical protein